jgi:hypothetical protein
VQAFSRWLTLTLLLFAVVTSACRSTPDETSLRDELLYSVEGVGRTYGIVQITSGAERSLPATAQYLTWAQDGEHLVGLARGDVGPRPSGLPVSIDFKRTTVVVLARDGTITRSTAVSALEPFEVLSQVATVGY